MAAKKATAIAPAAASTEREYSSIRVIDQIGVRISGANGNTLVAGGSRKIVLRETPYPHFAILPEGVEVPVVNVASATPASSPAANVRRRTPETLASRLANRANKHEFLISRATKPKPPPVVAEAEEVDDGDE